jgi:hypothetical protein
MPSKIPRGFDLGGFVAENDNLLLSAYVDTGDYEKVESPADHRRFIVGRTGCGKSALFKRLEERKPKRVRRISPQDLSLAYLSNLDIVRRLTEMGVRLDQFFLGLWQHVIVVELLRHRYGLTSPSIQQRILDQLRVKFAKDPARQRAIEYLNEFGDKFWCEADERVRQIAEKFERAIHAAGDIRAEVSPQFGASASSGVDTRVEREVHREETAKYQKVVNEIQLPRLTEMIRILSDTILDSKQVYTYLVIDDLDLEWAEDNVEHLLIRCLFQAVITLQKVQHLKVLVALRTNIFHQLTYGLGRVEHQSEKFSNLAYEIKWTRNDIKGLLDQRVREQAKNFGVPFTTVDELLPRAKQVGQKGLDYLWLARYFVPEMRLCS